MDVTTDGWHVWSRYWDYFRFITNHAPPRPNAAWFQLKLDVTGVGPWIFWIAGFVNIAVGVVTRGWVNLAFGAALLVAWLLMFVRTARDLRDCPTGVAMIDTVSPFRRSKRFSTGMAVMPDGTEVRIVVPTVLVSDVVDGGRKAEVAFVYDPPSRYYLAVAARPLPAADRVGVKPSQ
jgi:hypothetical protein